MIEVKMTFENRAELLDFFIGSAVAPAAKEAAVQASAPRLAAAAADTGIPAQEVKRGPGRPPKAAKPAVVEQAPAPAAAPVPAPADEQTEVVETTFEDYKTFMTGAYTGGHRGIVLEVLAEYGAQKISGIPADKYDEVMAQVKKRMEEVA